MLLLGKREESKSSKVRMFIFFRKIALGLINYMLVPSNILSKTSKNTKSQQNLEKQLTKNLKLMNLDATKKSEINEFDR